MPFDSTYIHVLVKDTKLWRELLGYWLAFTVGDSAECTVCHTSTTLTSSSTGRVMTWACSLLSRTSHPPPSSTPADSTHESDIVPVRWPLTGRTYNHTEGGNNPRKLYRWTQNESSPLSAGWLIKQLQMFHRKKKQKTDLDVNLDMILVLQSEKTMGTWIFHFMGPLRLNSFIRFSKT